MDTFQAQFEYSKTPFWYERFLWIVECFEKVFKIIHGLKEEENVFVFVIFAFS